MVGVKKKGHTVPPSLISWFSWCCPAYYHVHPYRSTLVFLDFLEFVHNPHILCNIVGLLYIQLVCFFGRLNYHYRPCFYHRTYGDFQ